MALAVHLLQCRDISASIVELKWRSLKFNKSEHFLWKPFSRKIVTKTTLDKFVEWMLKMFFYCLFQVEFGTSWMKNKRINEFSIRMLCLPLRMYSHRFVSFWRIHRKQQIASVCLLRRVIFNICCSSHRRSWVWVIRIQYAHTYKRCTAQRRVFLLNDDFIHRTRWLLTLLCIHTIHALCTTHLPTSQRLWLSINAVCLPLALLLFPNSIVWCVRVCVCVSMPQVYVWVYVYALYSSFSLAFRSGSFR